MSKKIILVCGTAFIVIAAGIIGYLFFFRTIQSVKLESTNIPSEAWNRDINAEGYLDGAPIGGLGAGTVTWRNDGNFYNGRLIVGSSNTKVDSNCGFYMYQKPSSKSASAKRLDGKTFGSDQAKYYSLFPKSWVDYYGSEFTCKAKVTQFSPIIPGDYQRTSYPVGLYKWEVTNPTEEACDVSIMFVWNNGFQGKAVEPVIDKDSDLVGVKLKTVKSTDGTRPKSACEFTIAGKQVSGTKITYSSANNLVKLNEDFSADGILDNKTGANAIGAISVNLSLRPGQTVIFPMVLSWDMPIVGGTVESDWYREYTRFFGRTGENSWSIAKEALSNIKEWEASIDKWQNSVLDNDRYPEWLKTSLFNELYYYFTGGTVWEAGAASGQPDNPDEDMFSHLETYIYAFYGTSDVRFYGSWALLALWPDIDKQCVKQFCDSVYNTRSDRPEAIGTCAHDIGTIGGVFKNWNSYTYRRTEDWKDLNSKLVLMVYRDWAMTGKTDTEFLKYCWIPVQKAMEKVKSQDIDGDGLPDSDGQDQTYDDMALKGNTSYCGGLFLAACEASKEIAKAMGDDKLADTYQSWLDMGKKSFDSELWNGSYYNMDTGSDLPTRIMDDQLCGQWYAKACGLPGIVPDSNAVSAFTEIYNNNFKKFDNGTHGIVNVMLPTGEIDPTSMQTEECWVGTSWGVVSGMIQQGMEKQADEIGKSLYDTIWNSGQLWFRTPEAWKTGITEIRAPYYMRATTVWAVKHAYDISSNGVEEKK